MIEKVNPSHPDKVADRIAGALVDLAYTKNYNARMAAEVLIGHGLCTIITETSEHIDHSEVRAIVDRIAGPKYKLRYVPNQQDKHLAKNQSGKIRCGDNGIFKGTTITPEQGELADIAREIYKRYPTDGKYILDGSRLIICQSNAKTKDLKKQYPDAIVNPLGDWTGGPGVDTGATNRKLGSDMGDSVTGGGLHGKDLSKADVSVNIWCWCQAQTKKRPIEASCAIGDESVNGVPFEEIVEVARRYIQYIGGFEKFAEWGLL